jgi:hypothetical protein
MRYLERSRMNRGTHGGDWMFRGMENPMECLAWSSHGRLWRSPQEFERGEKRWVATVKWRNPRGCLVRGFFIVLWGLSVVPIRVRYYQGSKETQPVSPYWYYRQWVDFIKGPIGSTYRALVLSRICRNPAISSYRYSRPRVGSTATFQNSNSGCISVLPTFCR